RLPGLRFCRPGKRSAARQAGRRELNKYVVSIFKPRIITSLTNSLLFIFTSISQILSEVKQTAN
ncbi:TPA: hypothetical protein ACJJ17_003044, partial [Enterobacter hormaechei subsp. xiangfangensis]